MMQTGFAKCHTSKLYSAPHLAEKSSYTQNLNFLLKVFVKCDLRELNTQSAKQYPQNKLHTAKLSLRTAY